MFLFRLLPWEYAIRNLFRRTLRTALTFVGLTTVVLLIFVVVGFIRGLEKSLTVSGDPRSLPATVELSAYRIVEYLVAALDEHPVRVTVRFTDDALEILVEGSAARGPQVRAAITRVRERAKLHAGSVDVKLTRGFARVRAQLPVPS